MNIFFIFNALFALRFYLVRSVRANICPGLVFQSVGTSFINKLPLHSPPPLTPPHPLISLNCWRGLISRLHSWPRCQWALYRIYVKEPRAPSGASSARICARAGYRAALHGGPLSSVSLTPLSGLLSPSSRPPHLLSSDASLRLAPRTSFNADKRFSQPPVAPGDRGGAANRLASIAEEAQTCAHTTTTAAAQQEVSTTC